jgi:hypothetical protein
VTLVGAVRVFCTVLCIMFLAAAATVALVPLPPPAAGGTCGPATSSESAIVAFFDPVSIGAGPEPSAASGARPQWFAFVSDCHSTTDMRMVTVGSILVGAGLLGLGLPWFVRRFATEDHPGQPGLPPPGWYADPTNPSVSRWWDGRAWETGYCSSEQHPSVPSHR